MIKDAVTADPALSVRKCRKYLRKDNRSSTPKPGSSRLARPGHAVADPAHVKDIAWPARVIPELLADHFDEGAHDLRIAVAPLGPDPFQQHQGGRDPSGVEREDAQQLEFSGGEFDVAPGPDAPTMGLARPLADGEAEARPAASENLRNSCARRSVIQ